MTPPVSSVAQILGALQGLQLLGVASRAAGQGRSKLSILKQPESATPPTPDAKAEGVPASAPAGPSLPSDFRLTPSMKGLLEPALAEAGFKILDQERRFLTTKIVHSLAQNGGKQRSMLAVPPGVAEEPSGATLLAFHQLEYFFDKGTYVCLLSERVDTPHWRVRDIIETRWPGSPGHPLQAKWLPWRDLEELRRAGTDADRLEVLRNLFSISAFTQPAETNKEMAPQDKIALIRVLAGMDDFSTAALRKTALGVAGLGNFSDTPGDNARQACGALLLRLESAGGNPHPLRLLIDYMLQLDLKADDKTIVTGLIERYDFLK